MTVEKNHVAAKEAELIKTKSIVFNNNITVTQVEQYPSLYPNSNKGHVNPHSGLGKIFSCLQAQFSP